MRSGGDLIFGDPAQFAIRFKEYDVAKQVNRSILQTDHRLQIHAHFIIAGEALGIEDDQFMLGTWLLHIGRLVKLMRESEVPFYNPIFQGLRIDEIVALVLKANQLKEEYDPQYAYLPVVDSDIWNKHLLDFGYITDRHLLVFFDDGNGFRVIRATWRAYEAKGADALYVATVEARAVIKAAEEFASYARQHYRLEQQK